MTDALRRAIEVLASSTAFLEPTDAIHAHELGLAGSWTPRQQILAWHLVNKHAGLLLAMQIDARAIREPLPTAAYVEAEA